jgi:hypothetical protein
VQNAANKRRDGPQIVVEDGQIGPSADLEAATIRQAELGRGSRGAHPGGRDE